MDCRGIGIKYRCGKPIRSFASHLAIFAGRPTFVPLYLFGCHIFQAVDNFTARLQVLWRAFADFNVHARRHRGH